MASKAERIFDLYQNNLRELSEYKNWTAFLRSAAWQYKYSFSDQVSIYAQRPDATACASMEVWNTDIRRWVNRGAKGIALLRENGGRYYLNYVFDISDTNSFYGNELNLWRYDNQYDSAVIESLEKTFGELTAKDNLADAVVHSAHNAVLSNSEYLDRLFAERYDSLLEELDQDNIDERYRLTAEMSAAYVVLQRLGYNPDEILDPENFQYIRDFNTPETISVLGTAVSAVSEDILSEIREAASKQRKFAKSQRAVYNESKINERSAEHGNDIHTERRVSDPELGSTAGNLSNREIRNDAEDISAEQPQEQIQRDADDRNAPQTLGGNRQGSVGADRGGSSENGGQGERERADERERSARLDGNDEQFSQLGGTADTERTDLQLSLDDLFPSIQEQQNIVRQAEQNGSAFSVPVLPQQITDEVLASGSNKSDSVLRICIEYSKDKTPAENINFLKSEYGTGGKGFIFDGAKTAVWWNEDGIKIARGNNAMLNPRSMTIGWEQIDSRIRELLELGRYAPQETLDRMDEYEYREAAHAFWYMHQDINSDDFPELKNSFPEGLFDGGFPASTAKIAEMLKDPDGLDRLISDTEALYDSYKYDNSVMRWNLYTPDKVLGRLEDLRLERVHFTADNHNRMETGRFITEDELDSLFLRGSGFSESKIRIYQFFTENTDTKERINFLKTEYGTGGTGADVFSERHGAKGITFSRDDIFSPNAKVDISWSKATSRIDRLIKSGRYLTEKQIAEDIPRYNERRERERIRGEQIRFVQSASEMSPQERFATLTTRLEYYINTIDLSDRRHIESAGLSDLIGADKFRLADMIKNSDKRAEIIDCLETIKGRTPDVYARSNAYNIAEELKEFQVINIHRVGDFYEVYGDDAEKASEILGFTTTTKHIDGEDIVMTGFPAFNIDFYEEELNKNGIALNIVSDVASVMPETDEHIAADISETDDTDKNHDDLIGRELEIDDRKFVIDSISETGGDVTMRDISFENDVGFPISRVEKIGMVRRILNEQKEPIVPNNNIQTPVTIAGNIIYPEIPMPERVNFRITDDNLGVGGAKEKFNNNINAIMTLKKCESENRLAMPEEQEILSKYVGWGGLQEAFDETKQNWSNEYLQLKGLLTDDEYISARESTLTAFYTPPAVIRSVYTALENMGLRQGNILDPAMGIGNFEGMLPDSLKDCKMYGVEIDSISGRIAHQLYQKNTIAIKGYEDTDLPDSFFDAAVGNVPFGQFKVADRKYDRHNFLIHDYFFAKTLDKVRPGGVIAFVTSSGTMDKKNSSVRKYIAQRAELIGAVRLPNNTFKANAGTEVTSDIIFLQKRDRLIDIEPEWVHLGIDENGFAINQYFVDNPNMILGEMVEESGPFGMQLNCKARDGANLNELLNAAVQNLDARITEYEFGGAEAADAEYIPADPNVRNYSYTVVDGDIYYRENSVMHKVNVSKTAENRIKGMIEIRDCVRTLIEYQTEGYSNAEIKNQQLKLNTLYDKYTKKYGLINSRGNNMAFSADSGYFLLCSLEILNDNGELERKADMFTKRTIGAKQEISHVDTASEALAVSIGEKAEVDMEYMSGLTGKSEDELFNDLQGVIFLNPLYGISGSEKKYLTADDYLSGNVREKLRTAKAKAESDDRYAINVEALEKVQPKDLTAAEISVRLGTTWIPESDYRDFIHELLTPSFWARENINLGYTPYTGVWNISRKSYDRGNVKVYNTYGTDRKNAYEIIEETLNLKDVRVFDYVEDENGNRKAVLNSKETTIAQQKQQAIKDAFQEWIWKDPQRRERLTKMYNEKFNSIRPREYDGSHIRLPEMNPEIKLRKHQKNAVARILYGGNTLLGHVVGAGKTWTMAAAAMESKRLGLCNKSLFVVPNHLTEQWASEFLQLYPGANILVASKKDFETKNRKKFCGRIATGDYDAVIIGHSQFEKIPVSIERQRMLLSRQLNEIVTGIIEAKESRAERFTIKQLEKTRRSVETKLKSLNDQSKKDDVITFEQLGIDKLFVDEAHFYKNLYLYTKMRNVGGIAQTEAKKSSDLFMKCRYLDELTGSRGICFATGTPISNSMVELYTMQRYLQYDTIAAKGLQNFDAWASTFGETVTAIELAPEGSGYRAKTRFAKFYNLPELMNMFKESADIQTADMLKLPVPAADFHNIAVEPTEIQKRIVKSLSERAERVRKQTVDPTVDNMLKITNDGRKLALDQRLIDPMLPDETQTKVSICADKVYDIWRKTTENIGAQLLFCDLSTPKSDGEFSVYNDIRDKLTDKGIPESQIAFIHEAKNEAQKKELFASVRNGKVRILLGSTQKMGAGTNVQKHLVAMHDLDCPWRPSDLEQRLGRIVRQGNLNDRVDIYRYVTKDTFDSYMYQLVEHKQKFISQVMTSKSPVRSAEDIDEVALSYAEIKALATGNPHIKEKMELDTEVAKLKLLKSNFLTQKYALEDKIIKYYPEQIRSYEGKISGAQKDIKIIEQHPRTDESFNPMELNGAVYTDKEQAGKRLIEICKSTNSASEVPIGNYRGFDMSIYYEPFYLKYMMALKGSLSYSIELGTDTFGNIRRIDNALESIPARLEKFKTSLAETKQQFENAKTEAAKDFPQNDELEEKSKRLAALDALLNMDKKQSEAVDVSVPDDDQDKRKNREIER